MTTAADHYRNASDDFDTACAAQTQGDLGEFDARMRMAEWHQRQAQLRLAALNQVPWTDDTEIHKTERRAITQLLRESHDEG